MTHSLAMSRASTTSLKRVGCLSLLAFCILLVGCDSKSSATSMASNASTNQSGTDSAALNDSNYDANETSETDEGGDLADSINSADEGESLIAAASPTNSTQKPRSPMVAEQHPGSALQATLIGDYVGMLPCSFCDSTAVILNLFADGSVTKTSIYKNPEFPKEPLVESGVYRQDNKMITIVYDQKNIESYQVQDSHLLMMSDGIPKVDYVLSRQ